MEQVETLIVGAGVSGLAAAAALGRGHDYLIIERDDRIGGYCKTVLRDGFTWDYSGHFFHFKHPEIEAWLLANMPGQRVRRVQKRAFIHYGDRRLDFPFQKNIHQLPQAEFIDCLHDLWRAQAGEEPAPKSFKQMLERRYGRGIAEKFLIPYNEKLYACDLDSLDPDAMGRFFPRASFDDVMRQLRAPVDDSYNQTFTYPEGGAIQYVQAIARDVRMDRVHVEEPLLSVDLAERVARTPRRAVRFRRLISSAPLPQLLHLSGLAHDAGAWSWNQVLVFNLGFDAKGPADVHWLYYPQRELSFYRVGFYDNIFDADRMSLYVELGFPRGASPEPEALRARVLEDLRRAGVVTDQRLLAWHHVLMSPAYVHVTGRGNQEAARVRAALATRGVYSIGRYGGWTYCSIEDNIVEARELVARLGRDPLL